MFWIEQEVLLALITAESTINYILDYKSITNYVMGLKELIVYVH
jgi:hypothetical protein